MKKVGLIILGVLFGLSLIELLVQLFLPQPPFNQDPLNRGLFTQPGSYPYQTPEFSTVVQVNAHGYVDDEWTEKSKHRSLIIGDSFVQAAQVPLQSGLGRQLKMRLPNQEFLSMGVPGAGTTTAVELVKRDAIALQVDSIYLGFLLSNDIFNNHGQLDTKDDKPYRNLRGDTLEAYKPIAIPRYLLLQKSHLFRLVLRGFIKKEIQKSLLPPNGHPPLFDVYQEPRSPTWKEAWTITELLLKELSEWAQGNEIQLGFFLIPAQHDVDPDNWSKKVEKWPSLRHHSPQSTHAKALKMMSQIAPTCDLFDAFTNQTQRFYFPVDGHWTAFGHQQAAEHLVPFIERLNTGPIEMLEYDYSGK